MSRRLWTILVLWSTAAMLSVTGQNLSNVAQCISPFTWSINSLGQTPCLVAAALESACGTPTSVDSIPAGNHYLAPNFTLANPCLCSSVTYSMISACGGCQNRTFIDWLTWSANCITTSLTAFPKSIPTGIVVPSWAYLNVTLTNNNFSVLAAEQNSTNSISSSATMTTTSVSTLLTASTFPSAGKSKSKAGAIAGGVVGGLVLVVIIALTALWCFLMRKRRNENQKAIASGVRPQVSGPSMSQTTRSTQGPSPFPSQSIYTSDMSTFLGSPLTTSGVHTTIPPSRKSLESVSLSVAQLGGVPQIGPGQRGYTGMPEI